MATGKAAGLDTWERLSGKRLGAPAIVTWLRPRLRAAAIEVEPAPRGLRVRADTLSIELVLDGGIVVAFVAGRRIIVKTAMQLTAEINVMLRQHELRAG